MYLLCMGKNKCWNFFVGGAVAFVVMLLHVNAILKSEDPIGDAQSDPISYDQVLEQEKEGVKAAATPKVVYYGGQGFLTKSSVAKNELPTIGKEKKKKELFNWSEWWDAKPEEPSAEEVLEPDTDGQEAGNAPESENLSDSKTGEQAGASLSEHPDEILLPEESAAVESTSDWW